MELKDTIELMQSDDYTDRFKAEYYQTKIRYRKLIEMLARNESGTLPFTLNSPPDVFVNQAARMKDYLEILELRAEIEHIDLGPDNVPTAKIDTQSENLETIISILKEYHMCHYDVQGNTVSIYDNDGMYDVIRAEKYGISYNGKLVDVKTLKRLICQ